MINFKTEEHSAEWEQIFSNNLDRYAKCVQELAERIPGLDDWPTAMEMANRLIDETDVSFLQKYEKEYVSNKKTKKSPPLCCGD
ncbi:hypothetical protein EBU94_06730 [bacterium]|nr:hypothetical protein [bacterium]